MKGHMWECECGAIEYGKQPPTECGECNTIGKFTRVPEDKIEEKETRAILSGQSEEDEIGEEEWEEYPE